MWMCLLLLCKTGFLDIASAALLSPFNIIAFSYGSLYLDKRTFL